MPENYHALDNLRRATETFAERNKQYGDSYKNFGRLCLALFPQGIGLETESDFNRFGVIFMILSKLSRYSANPDKGHLDSAHDMGVYAFILEELDAAAQGLPTLRPGDQPSLFASFCEHVYDNTKRACCKLCPHVQKHEHEWEEIGEGDPLYTRCKLCAISFTEWEEATRQ